MVIQDQYETGEIEDMTRDSFVFLGRYMKSFAKLTMEQRGILITAMMSYQIGDDLPEMDAITDMAFSFIKDDMDFNNQKYDEKCERNRENGKKGGRPKGKKVLMTLTGKTVPEGEVDNMHFLYLIKDNVSGEYKIGETSNLWQRRYDIKRPTERLEIVDFVLASTYECQKEERELLRKYKDYSAGGDWFVADNRIADEITDRFLNIANGYFQYPTKTLSESESESNYESNKKDILSSSVSEIIDYLNSKAGTRYSKTSKQTISHIKARLDEGFTVEDFKTVIDKKAKWKQDPKMCTYLRPETLFCPSHFESYLNEIEVQSVAPAQLDVPKTVYDKIHNYAERDVDYAALGAELLK